MNIYNLTQAHKWLATLKLYKAQSQNNPIYISIIPITLIRSEPNTQTPELTHMATAYGTSPQDYSISWWQFNSAPQWLKNTGSNYNDSLVQAEALKTIPNICRNLHVNFDKLKPPFLYIDSPAPQTFPLSQKRAKRAINATWLTALQELIDEVILADSNYTLDALANHFDLNLENHTAVFTDIRTIQHFFPNGSKSFDPIEFVPALNIDSQDEVNCLNDETLKKLATTEAIKLLQYFFESKTHAKTFNIPYHSGISHDFNLALKQLIPGANNHYLEKGNDYNSFQRTLNSVMRPLHRLSQTGLPIGEDGFKKIKALSDFYQYHYSKLKEETESTAKKCFGRNTFNPSDNTNLRSILFGKKNEGGLELEPLKESGKHGKFWSDLSAEEKKSAAPSIDDQSLNYLKAQIEGDTAKYCLIGLILKYRKIRYYIDNYFPDNSGHKSLFSDINKDGTTKIKCDPFTSTFRLRYHPGLVGSIIKNETNSVQAICGQAPPYEVRNCVTALPGHVLLFRDWISAEAHLLMFRSNDENGLRVINEQLDFHILIGLGNDTELKKNLRHWQLKDNCLLNELKKKSKDSYHISGYSTPKDYFHFLHQLFQSSKESDAHLLLKTLFPNKREQLKTITYGVPNGISPQSIATSIGLPLDKAQQLISNYRETYKQASTYLDLNANFAKAYRHIPSPWGWVKQFPQSLDPSSIGRKAYSFQPQHGIAWMLLQAINDWHFYKNKYNLKSEFMLPLHDGLGFHVLESELNDIIEITDIIMTHKRPVAPTDSRTIPTQLSVTNSWGSRELPY